jgi:DNA helicase II / ATP-dependent DNA helicase PcrA
MTVHSAKGLEFDAVFITGLEEGLFPHENSAKERDGMEEERRLMYVATTRAKRRLFLSFSQTRMLHGQVRYNARSRFLNELPDENVKWLTPQIKHSWFAPPKSAWDTDDFSSLAHHNIVQENAAGWRPGLNVKHAKFGDGIIVKLEGSGNNCRAHIQFNQSGLKVLDLNVAKLEKV